jgi:hypothetical protein
MENGVWGRDGWVVNTILFIAVWIWNLRLELELEFELEFELDVGFVCVAD